MSRSKRPLITPGLCDRCGRTFNGARGLAAHQRHCVLSQQVRAPATEFEPPAPACPLRLSDSTPKRPADWGDRLASLSSNDQQAIRSLVCPCCRLQCRVKYGLSQHLRAKHPELYKQIEPAPRYTAANFAAKAAVDPDAITESVTHVLFECRALQALRPPHLQLNCSPQDSAVARTVAQALSNPDTADFVRAACDSLPRRPKAEETLRKRLVRIARESILARERAVKVVTDYDADLAAPGTDPGLADRRPTACDGVPASTTT